MWEIGVPFFDGWRSWGPQEQATYAVLVVWVVSIVYCSLKANDARLAARKIFREV